MTGFEATRVLIEVLESENIDYLVAGSLSSSAYGIPRSTKDADLVLSVDKTGLERLTRRLPPEFEFDPQISFESVTGTLRYIVNCSCSARTIMIRSVFTGVSGWRRPKSAKFGYRQRRMSS